MFQRLPWSGWSKTSGWGTGLDARAPTGSTRDHDARARRCGHGAEEKALKDDVDAPDEHCARVRGRALQPIRRQWDSWFAGAVKT